MKHDIMIKRAQYITKNNEMLKEFFFAHPETRLRTNQICNSHFTGSPIWDLFSKEAGMVENSWNRSVRCMFDLPLQTHRSLIEPVSNVKHVKFLLMKRFLGFLSQIKNSDKTAPKVLLECIICDTRYITGSNLRNSMLLTGKDRVEDLKEKDITRYKYAPVESEDIYAQSR